MVFKYVQNPTELLEENIRRTNEGIDDARLGEAKEDGM